MNEDEKIFSDLLKKSDGAMIIGQTIRQARELQGISQKVLGMAVGLKYRQIGNIESGQFKTLKMFKRIKALLDFLGLKMTELSGSVM